MSSSPSQSYPILSPLKEQRQEIVAFWEPFKVSILPAWIQINGTAAILFVPGGLEIARDLADGRWKCRWIPQTQFPQSLAAAFSMGPPKVLRLVYRYFEITIYAIDWRNIHRSPHSMMYEFFPTRARMFRLSIYLVPIDSPHSIYVNSSQIFVVDSMLPRRKERALLQTYCLDTYVPTLWSILCPGTTLPLPNRIRLLPTTCSISESGE